MQFAEKVGLPQNIVCPRGSSHRGYASETDFAHKKGFSFQFDGNVLIPGSKIPKWFNHQIVINILYQVPMLSTFSLMVIKYSTQILYICQQHRLILIYGLSI